MGVPSQTAETLQILADKVGSIAQQMICRKDSAERKIISYIIHDLNLIHLRYNEVRKKLMDM